MPSRRVKPLMFPLCSLCSAPKQNRRTETSLRLQDRGCLPSRYSSNSRAQPFNPRSSTSAIRDRRANLRGFLRAQFYFNGRFNSSCRQSGVSSFKTSGGAAACSWVSGASGSGFGKTICERNGSISIKYPILPRCYRATLDKCGPTEIILPSFQRF